MNKKKKSSGNNFLLRKYHPADILREGGKGAGGTNDNLFVRESSSSSSSSSWALVDDEDPNANSLVPVVPSEKGSVGAVVPYSSSGGPSLPVYNKWSTASPFLYPKVQLKKNKWKEDKVVKYEGGKKWRRGALGGMVNGSSVKEEEKDNNIMEGDGEPPKRKRPRLEEKETKGVPLSLDSLLRIQCSKRKGKRMKKRRRKGQQTSINNYGKTVATLTIPDNPVVNHTIELHRDRRDVERNIELLEEEGLVHYVEQLQGFTEPKGKVLPLDRTNIPMTPYQVQEVLQQRLPILLAHGGFTHMNKMPFEILCEILEDFYKKMAHRLKQVREMEMSGGEQEFPDLLERVLVEMNMGGTAGLRRYYEKRILANRQRMEEKCLSIRFNYASKIRQKVGMTANSSTSSSSSSTMATTSTTSTTASSAPPLPTSSASGVSTPASSSASSSSQSGNSVLKQILSGLETPTTGSSNPFHHPNRDDLSRVSQQPPTPTTPSSSDVPFSKQQLYLPSSNGEEPIQIQIQTPKVNVQTTDVSLSSVQLSSSPSTSSPSSSSSSLLRQYVLSPSSNSRPSSAQRRPSQQGAAPKSTSSMVSINLNNNADLGGTFVPLNSPDGGATRVNITKGIITYGAPPSVPPNLLPGGGGGDCKTKLKEALSQRNLLRLNFEQVPSTCESTVLLSSSSPSLSSPSSNNLPKTQPPNPPSNTKSSLSNQNQQQHTTRLKL